MRTGPGRGRYYYDCQQDRAEQARAQGVVCACGAMTLRAPDGSGWDIEVTPIDSEVA